MYENVNKVNECGWVSLCAGKCLKVCEYLFVNEGGCVNLCAGRCLNVLNVYV